MVSRPHVDPAILRPIEPEEYDRLVADGFFAGEHVELIHRHLVTMSPQGAPHIWTINELSELLVLALSGRAKVQSQGPLALADSRPEPDVALLPLPSSPDQLASTAHLVVEVAVTSGDFDRGTKADLYASADIPEYWIVDVAAGEVEVRRDPRDGRYRSMATYGRDGTIALVRFPDVEVAVAKFVR